jgi:hypothetical protein
MTYTPIHEDERMWVSAELLWRWVAAERRSRVVRMCDSCQKWQVDWIKEIERKQERYALALGLAERIHR